MNDKELAVFNKLPTPEEHSSFRLARVMQVPDPHPYCITPKHVVIASDKFGGMLGESAIEAAERSGVSCGMRGCQLSYKQHKSLMSAVIVLQNGHPKDLNLIPGLHSYLLRIKEVEGNGLDGFAFPTESQEARTI